MSLRSTQFDDVYFSAEDGRAETAHVFLNGNKLPERWAGKSRFTIAETGFGTGLNILSAWKLFEETATPGQKLGFISFEKFPLTPQEILDGLSPWQAHFGGRLEAMCAAYPLRACGFHRLQLTPDITLTLVFDDVNDALPQMDVSVDCWFLDGFKPSTNPDMWSDVVFQNMARLSAPGASFATFTAAGFVKRGLQSAGFEIEKIPGFGRKREMMVGVKT